MISNAQHVGGQARKYSAVPIIFTVTVFTLVYVLLRHHWAGAVPWSEFSFDILNQGIGLAAFLLIMSSFGLDALGTLGIRLPDGWANSRNALCMTGFLMALIHALLSVMLFSLVLSSTLDLSDGTLTLFAGLSLLSGIVALVMLAAFNFSFQTFLREDRHFDRFTTSRKFMYFALLLVSAHLISLGYEDWMNLSDWQGGWPPGSLLVFLMFVLISLTNLLGRR